jgi:hypothetical protein
VGSLVLSACAKATHQPAIFTREMSEYAFTPGTLVLQVGQPVTINVINKGTLKHELMFGRSPNMDNDVPDGYEHNMFAETGVAPSITSQKMDTL